MTWDQARQHCQSNFTDLVSVPSDEEMQAVKALISRVSEYTFWLGLRRNTVSSPWEWSTGVAFQYSKWLSWEPDANGECGAMIPTGEWGAEPCADFHSFVCLAGPSALCGQREYFLVHTVKNADEAREHCRSLYTDLVSITSQVLELGKRGNFQLQQLGSTSASEEWNLCHDQDLSIEFWGMADEQLQ
ncbi:collectin-12-like [Acipenser ruthenus]|uniref:collectin-12-like n=1 Tax=Acipenser ruthenus TaxID=7906 RepID=UPI002741B959|nr:collectin-12-like [Acipenser ruthenus]